MIIYQNKYPTYLLHNHLSYFVKGISLQGEAVSEQNFRSFSRKISLKKKVLLASVFYATIINVETRIKLLLFKQKAIT